MQRNDAFFDPKAGLIHKAAEDGQADVLQALIDAKCDVNALVSKGKTMKTALELVSDEKCRSLLIAAFRAEEQSTTGAESVAQILASKVLRETKAATEKEAVVVELLDAVQGHAARSPRSCIFSTKRRMSTPATPTETPPSTSQP